MTSGSCVYLDGHGQALPVHLRGRRALLRAQEQPAGEAATLPDHGQPGGGLEVFEPGGPDHLEAYILSQSLPSGTGTTDADGREYASGSVQARFGMGFSWHWVGRHHGRHRGARHLRPGQRQLGHARHPAARHDRQDLDAGCFTVSETVVEAPGLGRLPLGGTITYGLEHRRAGQAHAKASSVFACDARSTPSTWATTSRPAA